MIHYYVNTDNGNNTWDGTSATYVSGTTGPKATLYGAEALLTSAFTDHVTIHCAGVADDTTAVTFSGMTTYSDKTLTIVGDATTGIWDNNKYSLVVTGASTIECYEDYVTVSQLQIKMVAGSTSSLKAIFFDNATAAANAGLVDRCNIWVTSDGTQGSCYGVSFAANSIGTVRNSVITGAKASGGSGYGIYSAGASCAVENCTVSDCGIGASRNGGTVTVTNCAVFNNADDYYASSGLTVAYSASDDSQTGTGNIDWTTEATIWAAVFTDYANRDFSLKNYTGSGALIGAGTDLSANGYTTDIAGTTRS